MAKFRTRLSELMKQRKLTRMDLVRNAHISYPTVVRWEEEEFASLDAGTLSKLQTALDCSLDELLVIVGDEPVKTKRK